MAQVSEMGGWLREQGLDHLVQAWYNELIDGETLLRIRVSEASMACLLACNTVCPRTLGHIPWALATPVVQTPEHCCPRTHSPFCLRGACRMSWSGTPSSKWGRRRRARSGGRWPRRATADRLAAPVAGAAGQEAGSIRHV